MCEYSQSRNYFRRIFLFLSFDFLLRKKLGLQKSKKKKKSSSTQPPLLSVILHNQYYNYRNQEINIGRILLILWTLLKFCQFHSKFPCFGPVSHPGPHTAFSVQVSLGSSNLWQFLNLYLSRLWHFRNVSYFAECTSI